MLVIGLFIGFFVGAFYIKMFYTSGFKNFTNEIYNQYKSELKRIKSANRKCKNCNCGN